MKNFNKSFKVQCTLRTSYRENNMIHLFNTMNHRRIERFGGLWIRRIHNSHLLFLTRHQRNISYERNRRNCSEYTSVKRQIGSYRKITKQRREIYTTLRIYWRKLSKKERRVDALALRAEERRDKLRKAAVRSKYPVTRRYLNGETRLSEPQSSIRQSITYGREPGELKHLSSRRKRKKHRFRE